MEIKRLPLLAAAIGFALMTGCKADPDYDLDRFDSTVTIGKNVTFPVGDVKEITVKDLFASFGDADGYLRTDFNGDYSLVFSGNASWNAFRLKSSVFESGQFFLNGYTDSPLVPGINVEQGMTRDAMQAVLGESRSFEFTLPLTWTPDEFPAEVKSVESADVDVTLNVFVFYHLFFKKLTLQAGSVFSFPDWLIVDGAGPYFEIEPGSNKMKAKVDIVIPEEGLIVPVHVSGLRNMSLTVTDDGYGRYIEGDVKGNVSVHLDADDYMYMENGIAREGVYIDVVGVDTWIDSASEVIFHKADVVFDEDVLNERFAGNVFAQDWELPEFLRNVDTDIRFSDLKLMVDVDNGLPAALKLSTSFHTEPETGWKPSYLFDIAEGKSSFTLTENEIPSLNGILSPVPTSFVASVDHIGLGPDPIRVEAEKDYNLALSTFLQVPLAFSEGSHFVFADTLRQLGVNAPLAEAQISLTAVNSLSLDVELSAEAVDWEGNVLKDVAVTISPSAISGGSLQSPGRTPLTFNIKDTSGKDKVEFDAIKMKIGLRCGSGRAGIQLNEKQGLAFEDVKISLPQGITTH